LFFDNDATSAFLFASIKLSNTHGQQDMGDDFGGFFVLLGQES